MIYYDLYADKGNLGIFRDLLKVDDSFDLYGKQYFIVEINRVEGYFLIKEKSNVQKKNHPTSSD